MKIQEILIVIFWTIIPTMAYAQGIKTNELSQYIIGEYKGNTISQLIQRSDSTVVGYVLFFQQLGSPQTVQGKNGIVIKSKESIDEIYNIGIQFLNTFNYDHREHKIIISEDEILRVYQPTGKPFIQLKYIRDGEVTTSVPFYRSDWETLFDNH
jgi:hypothetical protein